MHKTILSICLLGLLVMSISSCSSQDTPTLILHNGVVITVDSNKTAEAVAVKDDKILTVGSSEEILQLKSSDTKVIDLNGKTVIPGFIDSHAHFLGVGELKMQIDLMDSKSWDEVVAMVKDAVANATPGEWIISRGWHQEKWDKVPQPNIGGFPIHTELSNVSPDNPVILSHASGHAILANKKAMDLAGIKNTTADPAGGEIIRDKNGNAIGIFSEEAIGLIDEVYIESISKRTEEEKIADKIKIVNAAEQECLENGVTSFYDAGSMFEDIDLYKSLADKGELDVRLFVMISEENDSLAKHIADYKMVGYGNNFLTVNAIKSLIDGALGSRGAWLLEEYSDMPGQYGLNVTTPEVLQTTADIAKENGFQLCTHAIGDRGNRETLNVYENTLGKDNDRRWRIEHAQHLNPIDIPRFAELNVSVAMQGIHCTSDAPYVLKRLGEKRAVEGAYVWRTLIDLGVNVSNGTDSPVERVSPIKNYYASVTRKLSDGTEFYPNQKMTRMEALKSYTINGAYSGFEENFKGSITPGKLADLVVLSRNILEVKGEDILQTDILYTIVGGEVKFINDKVEGM